MLLLGCVGALPTLFTPATRSCLSHGWISVWGWNWEANPGSMEGLRELQLGWEPCGCCFDTSSHRVHEHSTGNAPGGTQVLHGRECPSLTFL